MGAHAEWMRAQERGGYGRGKLYHFTKEQIEQYERGWSRMMVDIWREKIIQLNITDSGALQGSLQELVSTGHVTTIEHKFLQYGLFVAAGVGKGFAHGNGGNLLFMGDKFREGKHEYGARQVGAGLSEEHMRSPKFKEVTVQRGPNAGKRAALTSGEKRMPRDWFFKKYYYSIRRLNLTEAEFYGKAYQGLMSSFLDELFTGTIRSNRF
ncbi:MAG: hypothetical protein K6G32_05700 [Prevotella sp.]|nr:hypothetical protein [Prevotella sp.]